MLFSSARFTQYTRTRLASMGLFFIFGLISASWGIHIPTVKEKFGLNAAQLSIVFFAIATGSVATLSWVGAWIERVGSRRSSIVGGMALCLSAGGILFAPSFILLIPLLSLFGIGTAILDVSVNTQASTLEKSLKKPVMSSMHCIHSLGGIIGAAGGGVLLSHGIRPSVHFVSITLICLFLVFFFSSALPKKQTPGTNKSHSHPTSRATNTPQIKHSRRALWILGGLTFITLGTETAIYDWITVYMREHLQAGTSWSSNAYAAFLTGVASGRFVGDFLRAYIGNRWLFALSGWLACITFAISLLLVAPSLTLLSFAITGLGFANLYPILLLSASHIEGMPAAEGIARVARIGYVGLLIVPALVGGIAQVTSLPISLILIPLCAALVALIGPRTIGRVLPQH